MILLRKKATQQLQEETIASVQERIRRRDRRWKRLDRLVETRAQKAEQEPDASEEAKTGLYVPVHTRFRDGREERTHQFDRDLVRAMGSMEELTGRELGQHVHKTEVSGPAGGPVQIDPRATAGYVLGTLADAAMYFTALIRAGRVKTGREDMAALAREINDRIEARRLGLEVPSLTEPYALPEVLDA